MHLQLVERTEDGVVSLQDFGEVTGPFFTDSDLNGDGELDLVLGHILDGEDYGRTEVLFGPDFSEFREFEHTRPLTTFGAGDSEGARLAVQGVDFKREEAGLAILSF